MSAVVCTPLYKVAGKKTVENDLTLHQSLSDEEYAALVDEVVGQRVVGIALWETSIADEAEGEAPPEERDIVDLDVYLENSRYFELYGAQLFSDLDSEPLRGLPRIGKIVADLANRGVWLDEIAATEEDELVLILCRRQTPQLYLVAGGWLLDTWDTLPAEE